MASTTTRRIVAEFSARNKAKGVMSGFRRDLGTTTRALRRMAMGALALAGVGGLGYMIKRQMEAIDATAKLSDRLGMTTEALAAMQHGAQIAGVEQGTFNKSLEIFSRRLGEVAMGVGEAKNALGALGLNYKELIDKSPDEAIGIVADQINRLSTQAEKAAAANYLFGRSGQQLLNFFEKGSAGIKEMHRAAERLGLTFSRIDAAKVEAANDALTRVKAVFTGIFRSATIELAPYIEAAADSFVDFATAGEGVGANIRNAFEAMSLAAIRLGGEIQDLNAKILNLTASAHEFVNVWQTVSPLGVAGGVKRQIKGEESHGQIADRLRMEATQLRRRQAGQENAVQRFYDDLERKAAARQQAGATTTIPGVFGPTITDPAQQGKRPGTDGAAALTTAEAAEARKRVQITARMYQEMGEYGEGYKEARTSMLQAQQAEYFDATQDRVLVDKWYNAQKAKLDDEMVEKNKAAQTEMEKFQAASYARMMQNQESAMGNMFYNMMMDSKNWKDHLKNYFKEVLAAFARMIAGMIARWVMYQTVKRMSSATSGGGAAAATMHGGGVVGEGSYPRRWVSSEEVAVAPRYHGGRGNLRSDEEVAVLKKGETVLPEGVQAQGGTVNVTVYAIDAQSTAQFFSKNKRMISNLMIGAFNRNEPVRRQAR